MADKYKKKQHAFRIFSQDLKEGNLPSVIFMYGSEEYLINWAVGEIAKRFISPGTESIDYVKLSDDCSADDLIEAAGMFSMFSEKRYLLCELSMKFA